ncbi:sulfotransferase [Pirellulales bacterium]|nr:sulfotransferase [Pirellulales bacterium]
MQLPNLLIIGAMKAGTTSLYMDVTEHPGAFCAADKEPGALCDDHVLTDEGRADYAQHYARADQGNVICDASTAYAKMPDYQGVAERAAAVLPPDFKVVYIVRHPITRIVSQHHHELTMGMVGPDINAATAVHPRFVQYSQYAYQLQPWIDQVGMERIRVISFEDYIARRQDVVREVLDFAGLSPAAHQADVEKVYNRSEGKHAKNSFWNMVQFNSAYRNWIRPLIPLDFRLWLYKRILPAAPERPSPPSDETTHRLARAVLDDVRQLRALLDRTEPLWPDLDDLAAAEHIGVGS